MPSELFGICVVGTSGNVYAVGDADYEFTIMSVSKPFIFALVCQALGVEEVRAENRRERHRAWRSTRWRASSAARTAGRIRWSIPGRSPRPAWCRAATCEAKWKFIHEGLSRFAGRKLPLNEEVYASASETNFRNQSIARMLQSYGRIYIDPAEAVDLYTKQCALNVSARDLAVMGATLADGGVNPITKERVVDAVGLPLRAGGDDHRRPVRDLGRLALRHRPAGQERHRRRDRHGLSGQGRPRDVRPAAR